MDRIFLIFTSLLQMEFKVNSYMMCKEFFWIFNHLMSKIYEESKKDNILCSISYTYIPPSLSLFLFILFPKKYMRLLSKNLILHWNKYGRNSQTKFLLLCWMELKVFKDRKKWEIKKGIYSTLTLRCMWIFIVYNLSKMLLIFKYVYMCNLLCCNILES